MTQIQLTHRIARTAAAACAVAVAAFSPALVPAVAQAAPAVKAAAPAACGVLSSGASATAQAAIKAACSQIGVWYTWTGGHDETSPGPTYGQVDKSDPVRSEYDPERKGFDCSGFVRWAWAQATGRDIIGNRSAAAIFDLPATARLNPDQTGALLPGDLVFWGKPGIDHVALYLGQGKIVQALESGTHIMVSDLTSHDMSQYRGAIRLSTAPGGPPSSGATVEGVAGAPAGDCASGDFCLYTGPNYTGTMFALYHCQEYNLQNWNGVGSWRNSNTGGAHALIQDKNNNTLVDSDPNGNAQAPTYDFTPVWHVKAC